MKKLMTAFALLTALVLTGCQTDAKVASSNLSKAAEMFEIERRVVFYNGITDVTLLTIEGRCSIDDDGNQLEVTCKISDKEVYKHFLGLSDNMTYFVQQTGLADVSVFHHRIIWKPQTVIPEIDLRTSKEALVENKH